MEEGYKIKVYQICSDVGELIYVGSTRQPLHKRFHQHKRKSERCSSKLLFEKYGADTCRIILIEEYVVTSREEQLRWEQFHINELKERIVNKCNAYQTEEELRDYQKKYREAYAEETRAYKKKYYEERAEEILTRQKQYREVHTEGIRIRNKKYREAHAEEIKAKKKKYYEAHAEEINARRRARHKAMKEL